MNLLLLQLQLYEVTFESLYDFVRSETRFTTFPLTINTRKLNLYLTDTTIKNLGLVRITDLFLEIQYIGGIRVPPANHCYKLSANITSKRLSTSDKTTSMFLEYFNNAGKILDRKTDKLITPSKIKVFNFSPKL